MIQKLKPPQTTDPAFILRQTYDDLNKIIEAVNRPNEKGKPENTEGKSGDIRLVKGRHGQYFLQARFDDGWVTTSKNVMQFAKDEEVLVDMVQAGSGLSYKPSTTTGGNAYELSLSDETSDLMVALAIAL